MSGCPATPTPMPRRSPSARAPGPRCAAPRACARRPTPGCLPSPASPIVARPGGRNMCRSHGRGATPSVGRCWNGWAWAPRPRSCRWPGHWGSPRSRPNRRSSIEASACWLKCSAVDTVATPSAVSGWRCPQCATSLCECSATMPYNIIRHGFFVPSPASSAIMNCRSSTHQPSGLFSRRATCAARDD